MPSLFRRADRPGPTGYIRLIQTADLHGSNAAFRKFLAAARQHGANHAIITGDLTGKAIVPIVRRNGHYEAWLFDNREVLETEAELERFRARVGDVGMYDHVCDPEEARALADDPARLHDLFVEKMNARLREWLDRAGEVLAPAGIPLWVIPGNDDDPSVDPVLAASEYARNVDHQVVELDERHELVSMGDTSMTPWACPRDYPEEHMERVVAELFGRVKNPAGAIVNMHCPPRDTKIDQCPALTKDLRIEYEAGQVLMTSAGSAAIRRGLETLQPVLSLHGHIHEARGVHRIGRTLCLNPGSEYAEGIMKASIVNLEPTRVKGYILISG
ncbi:MAG: metallophosphoesterase [Chloroflexota bacterium]|nr:MAG: metallophosphoesterase [Chloroflexota bacterium]